MSNDTLRIVIERHPNTEVTTFHVNRRLTASKRSLRFMHDQGQVTVEQLLSTGNRFDVEPLAQQLAEELYQIPGVSNGLFSGISVSEYEIRVNHAQAFDENEIEFAVIEAIANVLGEALDDLVYELNDYARSEEFQERQRIADLAFANMNL